MRRSRRLIPVALSAVLLTPACQSESKPGPAQAERLVVHVVRVDNAGTYASLADVDLEVQWDNRTFAARTDQQGRAVLEDVRPGQDARADLFFRAQDRDHAVIGWAGGFVTAPVSVTAEIPVTVETVQTDLTRLLGEVREWTVSGVGERSEAIVAYRHRLNLEVDPALRALDDRYVNASFVPGSGQINCVCLGPDPANCADEDLFCEDPGGFGSSANGFAFFVPWGTIELGFVERITDTETGRFVQVGEVYYEPEFEAQALATQTVTVKPDIEPDFDLCPGRGDALIELDGIGREYVSATRGGIEFSLSLVSATGLELPIMVDRKIESTFVDSQVGPKQVFRWQTPFALSDELAGFVYRYSLAATSSRIDDLGTTYVSRIDSAGDLGQQDICRLVVPAPDLAADFLSPGAIAPLSGSNRVINWLGETAPLRILKLYQGGSVAQTIWVTDDSVLELPLDSGVLKRLGLGSGVHTLEYSAVPGFDPQAGLLAEDDLAVYRQSHSFTIN